MKILGRESTLSRRLDQTLSDIAELDPKRDAAAMYRRLVAAQPELAIKLEQLIHDRPDAQVSLADLQETVGAGWVKRMQDIPVYVGELVAQVNKPDTPAAMRCAIVNVLALVAQPRDIIPDDAEGGYGFLDDAAVVSAAVVMVLQQRQVDAQLMEAFRESIDAMRGFVPEGARAGLQEEMDGVAQVFQAMSMLPASYADIATQKYLDQPDLATSPPAQAGWQSPFRQLPSTERGRWHHGALFDGGNVYVPGGPALVNGVFVPPS